MIDQSITFMQQKTFMLLKLNPIKLINVIYNNSAIILSICLRLNKIINYTKGMVVQITCHIDTSNIHKYLQKWTIGVQHLQLFRYA
jgi:hypothetical protein